MIRVLQLPQFTSILRSRTQDDFYSSYRETGIDRVVSRSLQSSFTDCSIQNCGGSKHVNGNSGFLQECGNILFEAVWHAWNVHTLGIVIVLSGVVGIRHNPGVVAELWWLLSADSGNSWAAAAGSLSKSVGSQSVQFSWFLLLLPSLFFFWHMCWQLIFQSFSPSRGAGASCLIRWWVCCAALIFKVSTVLFAHTWLTDICDIDLHKKGWWIPDILCRGLLHFTRWCIALVVLVLCEGEVQGKPSGKSCVRSGLGS
jgi:hypothetical protein